MYPAILLSFFYLMMMISVFQASPGNKKLFGMIGVSLAIMASMILITDYFIQVSVIQPSLLAGETDGISLLTQFNPHGIFIVLEEMGFLLMIFSFFALFPIFDGAGTVEKIIKWTVIIGLILAVASFLMISIIYGNHREYRFEVIIISITWLETIFIGFLISRYFKSKLHHAE
jgi:hypothetical protein